MRNNWCTSKSARNQPIFYLPKPLFWTAPLISVYSAWDRQLSCETGGNITFFCEVFPFEHLRSCWQGVWQKGADKLLQQPNNSTISYDLPDAQWVEIVYEGAYFFKFTFFLDNKFQINVYYRRFLMRLIPKFYLLNRKVLTDLFVWL